MNEKKIIKFIQKSISCKKPVKCEKPVKVDYWHEKVWYFRVSLGQESYYIGHTNLKNINILGRVFAVNDYIEHDYMYNIANAGVFEDERNFLWGFLNSIDFFWIIYKFDGENMYILLCFFR